MAKKPFSIIPRLTPAIKQVEVARLIQTHPHFTRVVQKLEKHVGESRLSALDAVAAAHELRETLVDIALDRHPDLPALAKTNPGAKTFGGIGLDPLPQEREWELRHPTGKHVIYLHAQIGYVPKVEIIKKKLTR